MPTQERKANWLVAEFCDNDLFNGWHLYLRESAGHERNSDGGWGWLRRGHWLLQSAHAAMMLLGVSMRPSGDGSCDDDGYAQLAQLFPLPSVNGQSRGGVPVSIGAAGVEIDRSRMIGANVAGVSP